MKKLFALMCVACLVASLSVVAAAGEKGGAMKGYITDAKCAKSAGAANPDCAKKCIENGEKAVFVSDADKAVYAIANPEKVKGHEGHHVAVKGSTANNELTIESVAMVSDKK